MTVKEMIETMQQLDPKAVIRITVLLASAEPPPSDIEAVPVIEFILGDKVIGYFTLSEDNDSHHVN